MEFSFSSTTEEALTTRGIGSNYKKGNRDVGQSKTYKLEKNQCAFYKEEGH